MSRDTEIQGESDRESESESESQSESKRAREQESEQRRSSGPQRRLLHKEGLLGGDGSKAWLGTCDLTAGRSAGSASAPTGCR